jgi:predicted negative regulator of RcsB-dependent stress response
MIEALHRGETKEAIRMGAELIEAYPRTPYAGMAALLAARLHLEAGDRQKARERLAWAVEHGRDPSSVVAARLRLARLLLSEDKPEEALKRLEGGDYTGFESEYHELKGDIYRRLGRFEEARAAYARALEHLPANAAYGTVLRMKHDDLGGGGRQS